MTNLRNQTPPPNTPLEKEEVCNNPKFYEIFGDAALTPAERVMKEVLLSEGEKQFLKDLELDAEKMQRNFFINFLNQ